MMEHRTPRTAPFAAIHYDPQHSYNIQNDSARCSSSTARDASRCAHRKLWSRARTTPNALDNPYVRNQRRRTTQIAFAAGTTGIPLSTRTRKAESPGDRDSPAAHHTATYLPNPRPHSHTKYAAAARMKSKRPLWAGSGSRNEFRAQLGRRPPERRAHIVTDVKIPSSPNSTRPAY